MIPGLPDSAGQPSSVPTAGNTPVLSTQLWPALAPPYSWPEQAAGVKPGLGLCFSGGGTRALSAAMGQMRALLKIGVMQQADYISSVSGGSWASAAFAYYSSGATSDEQFLGPITDPQDITLANLAVLDRGCLGHTATTNLGDVVLGLIGSVPVDQLWETAIGRTFFAPFGLWNEAAPKWFSLDAASVADICAANPSLDPSQFRTVRQPADYKIPYLLINATLDGPAGNAPYSHDPKVMVTFSPLACGIPFQQTVHYHEDDSARRRTALVGGGFIEPFAWGGGAPGEPAVDGRVTVPAPRRPFDLALSSGMSSSAFAAIFAHYHALDDLLPELDYWPPVAPPLMQPGAEKFLFGDGGNLENLGLIPLLLRGVQKVIVFANSDTPLSLDYDPAHAPTDDDIDSDLAVLFGFPIGEIPARDGVSVNRVFPATDWPVLAGKLRDAKRAGRPVVAAMTHVVQANSWWGLPGGGTVDVFYVYLDNVDQWRRHLELAVKADLDLGPLGQFRDFPNYATVDENLLPPQSLTMLTARQVNLLADLTCWVVRESRPAIEQFLACPAGGA